MAPDQLQSFLEPVHAPGPSRKVPRGLRIQAAGAPVGRFQPVLVWGAVFVC